MIVCFLVPSVLSVAIKRRGSENAIPEQFHKLNMDSHLFNWAMFNQNIGIANNIQSSDETLNTKPVVLLGDPALASINHRYSNADDLTNNILLNNEQIMEYFKPTRHENMDSENNIIVLGEPSITNNNYNYQIEGSLDVHDGKLLDWDRTVNLTSYNCAGM